MLLAAGDFATSHRQERTCSSEDNQKFYWDGARIKNKKWDGAKCIDYGYGDGKIYMHSRLGHSGSRCVLLSVRRTSFVRSPKSNVSAVSTFGSEATRKGRHFDPVM